MPCAMMSRRGGLDVVVACAKRLYDWLLSGIAPNVDAGCKGLTVVGQETQIIFRLGCMGLWLKAVV